MHDAETRGPVQMVAICTARKNREADLRSLLEEFVGVSRREPGCISYTLHSDVDDPGRFVFYEVWENQAAIDRHFADPGIQTLIARLEPVLREPAQLLRLRAID